MAHYKTLPTTNHEVAELFHDLGYSNEIIQAKYGLTHDLMEAFRTNTLAFYNDDYHIVFQPGSTKKDNDDWKEWADKKPSTFVLLVAKITLTLVISGKHVYKENGLPVTTPATIPFAITADTKPEEIFETLFKKIEEFSRSVKATVVSYKEDE